MANRYAYKNMANAKPEYALKRAQELIDMGNKEQALETLAIIATGNKKPKQWSKKLEILVSKFCLLCVDLNKASRAKDGLHHFKLVSQQYPQSVELVVNEFLAASEKAIDQVKSDSYVDPLPKLNIDPTLVHLLRGINVDEFTGEADKENVRPWLKFLFEAYKIALETLKNNPKLETAYKNVAKQAFEYCCKYNRVNEFKHLVSTQRNKHFLYNDSEDALTSQLEVKFAQLNASVTLELWSEAHNAIHEIHSTLILPSKVGAIPKETHLNYYAQLEKLLWVSKSYAPHAEALLKFSELKEEQDRVNLNSLLTTTKDPEEKAENERKRLEETEKVKKDSKTLTSRIVLAALCIPLSTKQDDPYCISYDAQKEKESKLTSLLIFEPHSSRSSLLKDLSETLFNNCESYIIDLYNLLEVNTQPFVFAKEVNKILSVLAETPEYKQYCETLQTISFVKLLQKLSSVYSSMEMKQLQKLFPSLSVQEIQQKAIFARGNGEVDCVIDHRREVINFSHVNFASQDVRFKLCEISRNLRKCVIEIDTNREVELSQKRELVFQTIAKNISQERQRLILRRQYIEKMKELREAEEAKNQKLAQERAVLAATEAEKREAEKVRKQQETSAAIKAAKQKELDEKKRNEMLQAKLKEMAKNIGTQASEKISEQLEEHFESSEDFVKRQLGQIVKERKAKEKLIEAELTSQNHLIRATRELELPFRKEAYEISLKKAKESHDKAVADRIKRLEILQKQKSETKARLSKIEVDFEQFKLKIDEEKAIEFQKKNKERDLKVAAWQKERERKRQEAEALQRKRVEEEERRKKEFEERERSELAEQQAKKDQQSTYKPNITPVGSRPIKPWEVNKSSTPSTPSSIGTPKYQPPSSTQSTAQKSDPFGGAKPVSTGIQTQKESPFGGAKPTTTTTPQQKESPFGGAKPTTTTSPQQKSDPFGGAKPVSTGPQTQKESPFGSARPTNTNSPQPKSDPFGGAKPVTNNTGSQTQKESPFGGARPTTTGSQPSTPQPKNDPFGGAKPVSTGSQTQKESPFGGAKPTTPSTTGKDSPYGGAKTVSTTGSNQQQGGGGGGEKWTRNPSGQQNNNNSNNRTTTSNTTPQQGGVKTGGPKPWDKPNNQSTTNNNNSTTDNKGKATTDDDGWTTKTKK